MRPVVFVGHDAERTGPPIYLLHLLTWARAHHPDVPVHVVLLRGGPLLHRYRRLAPTTVLNWFERSDDLQPLARVSRHPGRHRWLSARLEEVATRRVRRSLRGIDPAVVYFNCAATIKALPGLPWRAPRIAHVHELAAGLDHQLDARQLRTFLASDRVLVVSEPVRDLVTGHGVPAPRIGLHPGMVAVEPSVAPASRGPWHDEGGPLLVGTCATIDWRKGVDLFVRLAWTVRRLAPEAEICFRWVGGDAPGVALGRRLAADAGVGDLIEWTGEVDDAVDRIAALDVFVLTAREDAFPLVCLEAASSGVPIVTFDTGGAADLAAAGAGVTVPYPDVDAMAEAVLGFARDGDRRRSVGQVGAEQVRAAHAVDVLAPRVWAEVESLRP